MIDSVTDNLERYMDLLSARQKLVASNIANADTPGYKTEDIDFQSNFQSFLGTGSVDVAQVSGLPTKNDGNNVDLASEMTDMSEDQVQTQALSDALSTQFQILGDSMMASDGGTI